MSQLVAKFLKKLLRKNPVQGLSNTGFRREPRYSPGRFVESSDGVPLLHNDHARGQALKDIIQVIFYVFFFFKVFFEFFIFLREFQVEFLYPRLEFFIRLFQLPGDFIELLEGLTEKFQFFLFWSFLKVFVHEVLV